jgi:inorganic phosphate transporter, PiT family
MVLDFGILAPSVVIGMAAVAGLYMAWTIGANDVANAMGTSVGSKALSLRNAIILAGILEFAGAVLAGGSVTKTIKGKIIDPETTFMVSSQGNGSAMNGTAMNGTANATTPESFLVFSPELYVYGMLAALLGTAIWLTLATWWGMPVSTTHSIVGGVMGAGIFAAGTTLGWDRATESVNWETVNEIFQSWLFAPLLGGLIAFGLFWLIKIVVFNSTDPLAAVDRWRPLFIFLDVLIISMATFLKGLKNVDWYNGLHLSNNDQWTLSFAVAIAVTLVAEVIIRVRQRGHPHPTAEKVGPDKEVYKQVERRFVALQIVTAGSVAFAHGANDVANAIGPLAGIVTTIQTGAFAEKAKLAWWILPLGGAGIVVGLATWGWRVMLTIGKKISEITPSRGFAAELAAAATIILATVREIPVSTSQILVGAVIGVGLARGVAAIDLRVLRNIVFSWVLTLPAAALMSGVLFLLLKNSLD